MLPENNLIRGRGRCTQRLLGWGFNTSKMELNKDKYLQSVKKRQIEPGKINNEEQALVLEIWSHFQEKIAFGQLMTFVKKYGITGMYQSFNSVRQSTTCTNPPGMFIHLCKQLPKLKTSGVKLAQLF